MVAVSTSCGVLKETKSHGYENVENSDLYLLGLPLYSVTKNFRNDSTVIQEVRVDYDDRYWPVCRTNFINGSITSQERYEYNDRLQLIKQKQCSYESTDTLGYTFMYYLTDACLKRLMPWDYLLTIRMTLQPDFCKAVLTLKDASPLHL